MIIYIGADHRGFNLKLRLKSFLKNEGYEVEDLGDLKYDDNDDYPDFARLVAQKVNMDPDSRGILICGSGVGVDIVANKFLGIRAALAISTEQIFAARHEDNVNILCLASDFIPGEDAEKIVQTFLRTQFGPEDRYKRRLDKIFEIENFKE